MFSKISKSLTRLLIIAIASLILGLITAIGVNATIHPTPSDASLSKTKLYAANHANFDIVNSIAKSTTVFIMPTELEGYDLKDSIYEEGAGSGMLVAHKGSTYYVLTNEHLVRSRGAYVIRTYDNKLHEITNYRPGYQSLGQKDTKAYLITRFGKFNNSRKLVSGYDLALVQFDSNKDYPIVPIGDSSRMNEGDTVFVSGWPLPKNNSDNRYRVLREGQLAKVLNPADPNGNYSLCYTAETAGGMSGGPVFNEQGEIIGIHGRGRNYSNPNCINTSFGIQVNDFIQEQNKLEQYRLSNYFLRPPVNGSEFARIVANASNADSLSPELLELLDISPSDPAYQAIDSLITRYDGCMQPYHDGTWRPNYAATRGEFVVDLNACLDTIVDLGSQANSNSGGVSRADFESVEQTVTELARQIAREVESL